MKQHKSILISAFPGTGKSWLTDNVKEFDTLDCAGDPEYHFKYHDSDSSKYSWIYDTEGNKTDQRNPDFPANYMEHIRTLMEEDGNIIFVSSHESVREVLVQAGFHFYIVRPALHLKDRYLEKYRERGNDEKFINLIDNNWYTWLTDIDKFQNEHMNQVTLVELRRDVYMQQAIKCLSKTDFMETGSRMIIYHNREEMVEAVREATENHEEIKTMSAEEEN